MIDAGELPDGWALTTLKEVVDNSKAKAEPGEHDDAPYLGLEHVEAGTSRILGQGVGSDVRSVKNVFQAGDILYGKLRPYLNKVCRPDFDGICSTDILVLKPKACIDSGFLRRLLTTHAVVEHSVSNSNGINLPRTSYEALSQFELTLPPLAEQRRIVAKIEELTARSRAARAALAEVPTLLEQFRQSVLATAFRGDLTADWREKNPVAEPASVLLERVRDERRKKWEAKYSKKLYIEADAVDDTELPELPEGWCWASLDEVVYGLQQGWSPKCENEGSASPEDWAVMKTTAVQAMSFCPEENKRLPSDLVPDESLQLRAGDLLITRAGPRVRAGVCCFVSNVRQRLILCDKAYRFRAIEPMMPEFIEAALNSPRSTRALDVMKTGISDSGVNLTQVRFLRLEIPLPPVLEQQVIVSRIGLAWSMAAATEHTILDTVTDLDGLDQSILAKAFRGELVPQNPADEPAAALLARIRSGGNATTPTRLAKRGQVKAYILLLLRTWNKPLGREMLERGLVLMLNADVRRAILGRSKPATRPAKKRGTPPQFVNGMDTLLGEMIDDGQLVPGLEAGFFAEGQHGIDFAAAPKADLDAVRETAVAMKVLHKDKQQATDADIVSALNGEIYELVS